MRPEFSSFSKFGCVLKISSLLVCSMFCRFKELSKALYSLTIQDLSQNMVSVMVPEGKVKDIAGNLNLASDQLEVRHCRHPSSSSGWSFKL